MRQRIDRLCRRLAAWGLALLLGAAPVWSQSNDPGAGDPSGSAGAEQGDFAGDPGNGTEPGYDAGGAESGEFGDAAGDLGGEADESDAVFAELESLSTGEPRAEGDEVDFGTGDLTASAANEGGSQGAGNEPDAQEAESEEENPFPTDEDPYGEEGPAVKDDQIVRDVDRTTVNGSIEATDEVTEKTEEQLQAQEEAEEKKKAEELAAKPKEGQKADEKDSKTAAKGKESGEKGAADKSGQGSSTAAKPTTDSEDEESSNSTSDSSQDQGTTSTQPETATQPDAATVYENQGQP